MNELLTFVHVGFRHIVDVEAMDHILFLVALAAVYRLRDARMALWVITAFTVGHSISLALAVTGVVRFSSAVVEFLIPVTIVATGVENLIVAARRRSSRSGWYRPVLAGVFGLVHGAGFATYLSALFVTHIALPLFGFNVGIELGQIVVLSAAAVLLSVVDLGIARLAVHRGTWAPLQVRIVAVSAVVVVVASHWAIERRPW
jgi:HupE / UreJ protein